MPDILVTDLQTGRPAYIPQEEYDPALHQLAADQVAVVTPSEGDEALVGQVVTEESLPGLYTEASPEAKAALTAAQVQAEQDTLANTLEQGLRGAVSGLTLGGSELLLGAGADTLEREQQRRERAAGGLAFTAGEILGGVGGTLASGGVGMAAKLGRLSPAAQLSKATARIAARGGLRNRLMADAAEGAVAAVGDALARQTIAENPDFSAAALVSSAAQGALFGAAGGAIGDLVAKGAGKAAKALDVPDVQRAGKAVAPDVGLFKGGRRTSYKRVAGDRLADTSADSARALGAKLDDMAARAPALEVDDLLRRAGADLGDDVADLGKRARAAANRLDEANKAAKSWYGKYADDVGLATAQKRITKEVSAEVEDAGINALGDLDWAAKEYDDLAEELAARLGAQRTPVAPPANDIGRGLTERVRSAGAGIADVGGLALGAAELAGTAGVEGLPTVRDLPFVGGLTSAYLQVKAASKLGGKAAGGWFRSSRVSDAAETVTSARDRITAGVKRAASGALQRVAASPLPRITGRQLGARLEALALDRDQAANSATAYADHPEVAQAVGQSLTRAADFLLANAPKAPGGGAALHGRAEYDAVAVQQWQQMAAALADPIGALEQAVANPGAAVSPSLRAVREVYPALWSEYRAGLDAERDALARNLSDTRLISIGRAFDLPLTVANLPGYGQPTGPVPDPTQQGDVRFAAPTQVTTSPLVSGERDRKVRP